MTALPALKPPQVLGISSGPRARARQLQAKKLLKEAQGGAGSGGGRPSSGGVRKTPRRDKSRRSVKARHSNPPRGNGRSILASKVDLVGNSSDGSIGGDREIKYERQRAAKRVKVGPNKGACASDASALAPSRRPPKAPSHPSNASTGERGAHTGRPGLFQAAHLERQAIQGEFRVMLLKFQGVEVRWQAQSLVQALIGRLL